MRKITAFSSKYLLRAHLKDNTYVESELGLSGRSLSEKLNSSAECKHFTKSTRVIYGIVP